MGEFVRHQHEEIFIPEYRVTFGFTILPKTTRIVRVQGNTSLHLDATPAEQVLNAIHQAEVMLSLDENFAVGALNVGAYVIKVERESGHIKPWETVICAFRAVPGTEIKLVSWDRPLHRVEPKYEEKVEWVTVGRWESCRNDYATLITKDGRRLGDYVKQHIFVTR